MVGEQNNVGRKGQDRREFLRTLVRGPLLAGLSVLGGVLALRRPGAAWSEVCPDLDRCQGCGWLDSCNLPKAQQLRTPSSHHA